MRLLPLAPSTRHYNNLGADGWLRLEGVVRPVVFNWMQKVFLTKQFGDQSGDEFSGSTFLFTLLYPQDFDVVPPGAGLQVKQLVVKLSVASRQLGAFSLER